MENPPITSLSNPTIKRARALHQRKVRQETGLFLVEGIHHVGAAIEAGWTIDTLLYAPDLLTSEYAHKLVREQSILGIRCVPVAMDVFASLADKDNPQGILALFQQKRWAMEDLDVSQFEWGVAILSPQDPGNLGSILRTIDAVGADGLIELDGGVDPYHPSAVRASMGALFSKPVIHASFDAFISWVRLNGYRVLAASAHAQVDYRSLRGQNHKAILLLGSEQKGLSSEQMAACDKAVSIPMQGKVSSLNLAVAAGILLYAMLE